VITDSPTAHQPAERPAIRRQIAGVDVAELARRYGTPLYAYDAEMIRRRCRDLAAWDTVRFAQKAARA
jgi:diaminopimelate decarboxylase